MWLLLIFLVAILFYYSWRKQQFFSSRGVKTLPAVPFFGNLAASTFGMENFVDLLDKGYKKFENERYFGLYQNFTPTVVPRDPQLIKKIMCSDFFAFPDRALTIDPEIDHLTAQVISVLNGEKWRHVRDSVSPALSPARCRCMTPVMSDCSKNATEYLKEIIDKPQLLDFTDLSTPYVNDVVLSCAFGFASNSFKDKDNWLYKLGTNNALHTLAQILTFYGYQNFPFFMKLFKIKMVSTEDAEQFTNLFRATINARKAPGAEYRSDFIQTLIEASDDLTEDEQIAQAVQFIFGGYDTTIHLINYFMYEMADNPDIQERLCRELDSVNCDDEQLGKVIEKLEYLDQCVSETLRKWPVGATPDRCSVSTYDFGPTHEGSKYSLVAPPGINIWFPIFSLHRDEKYWPEPKKYDPERFNPENKAKIIPYTYIPFGVGPRRCIGYRFGLQAVKVFIYNFLREFRTTDPQVSQKISPITFVLRADNGFKMVIKKREDI